MVSISAYDAQALYPRSIETDSTAKEVTLFAASGLCRRSRAGVHLCHALLPCSFRFEEERQLKHNHNHFATMTHRRKTLRSALVRRGVPSDLVKFSAAYPMTRSKAKLMSSSKSTPSVSAPRAGRPKRLVRRPRQAVRKAKEPAARKEASVADNAVAKRPLGAAESAVSTGKKRKRAPPPQAARTSARLASTTATMSTQTPTTSSASTSVAARSSLASTAVNLLSSVPITYASSRAIVQSAQTPASGVARRLCSSTTATGQPVSVRCVDLAELKAQLKKATSKFNKACHQLVLLDQHMSDLQHSYANSLENDRKTFKIVYRMQLATLEGTHNAYIEYIERQVERIKRLKRILFNNTTLSNTNPASAVAMATTNPATVNNSTSTAATPSSSDTTAPPPPPSSSSLSSVYIPIIINAAQPAASGSTGHFEPIDTDDDTDGDDDEDLFESSSRLLAAAVNINSNI